MAECSICNILNSDESEQERFRDDYDEKRYDADSRCEIHTGYCTDCNVRLVWTRAQRVNFILNGKGLQKICAGCKTPKVYDNREDKDEGEGLANNFRKVAVSSAPHTGHYQKGNYIKSISNIGMEGHGLIKAPPMPRYGATKGLYTTPPQNNVVTPKQVEKSERRNDSPITVPIKRAEPMSIYCCGGRLCGFKFPLVEENGRLDFNNHLECTKSRKPHKTNWRDCLAIHKPKEGYQDRCVIQPEDVAEALMYWYCPTCRRPLHGGVINYYGLCLH